MKIGIYDPYLNTLGGGERYMLTVSSVLSHKHTVDVFWDEKTVLTKAQERFGLTLKRVHTVPNIFSGKTPFFKKLLETRKYDLIILLSDGSIPVTLAKQTVLHFQFPVNWVNGRSAATRVKLKRISKILCNSRYTKHYIDKTFRVNSLILYPPCGSEHTKPSDPSYKKNIILSVGRYNQLPDGTSFKKHEFLIETFKEMVDKDLSGWELVIAISNIHEHEKFVDVIEKKTEGHPIKIIRNPTFTEISKLYLLSKIYWHAAGFGNNVKDHPEWAEHFGITTVEAMSAGAVPVVFNAGGQKEIVRDGKNGFLWETKDQLISKTLQLTGQYHLWSTLAKAAAERANDFSTEKFSERLGKLIEI